VYLGVIQRALYIIGAHVRYYGQRPSSTLTKLIAEVESEVETLTEQGINKEKSVFARLARTAGKETQRQIAFIDLMYNFIVSSKNGRTF
jgi:hypothetical protein